MMKIEIVEDTFTPWLKKVEEQVVADAEEILRFALRNFYDEVLIEEVPVAEVPPHPAGYEVGSLLESGSEPFWKVMSSSDFTGLIIEFTGTNNPPENREHGGWYDFLPNKPYALYQHEEGKQNTHWLERPLEQQQSMIFTDIETRYWDILAKGGK